MTSLDIRQDESSVGPEKERQRSEYRERGEYLAGLLRDEQLMKRLKRLMGEVAGELPGGDLAVHKRDAVDGEPLVTPLKRSLEVFTVGEDEEGRPVKPEPITDDEASAGQALLTEEEQEKFAAAGGFGQLVKDVQEALFYQRVLEFERGKTPNLSSWHLLEEGEGEAEVDRASTDFRAGWDLAMQGYDDEGTSQFLKPTLT